MSSWDMAILLGFRDKTGKQENTVWHESDRYYNVAKYL